MWIPRFAGLDDRIESRVPGPIDRSIEEMDWDGDGMMSKTCVLRRRAVGASSSPKKTAFVALRASNKHARARSPFELPAAQSNGMLKKHWLRF